MKNLISNHPILPDKEGKIVKFTFDEKELQAYEGMAVSSALFMNDIKIFGEHYIDHSPLGIFCANGQCAQCTLIIDGKPQKSCMIPLKEGMVVQSCKGVPELPASDKEAKMSNIKTINKEVVIVGGGPSGLSAAKILGENGVEVLLIDDKDRLGGKLVLQTHKFFGSSEDVYAGRRGIEIAEILSDDISKLDSVEVWLQSTGLACYSDKLIGILKNNKEYVLVRPKHLLVATGAREKMLTFQGNVLPGVYGAGAFQTLVNRDMVKASNKIFIVGGGNVGLIAGYHAIQAGIEVVGLVEALPQCGGYKVHEDKLHRSGVPIFTSHTIISANGEDRVKSITIAKLDDNWHPIPGTEKTFECDTILIAVGLAPVNECYNKAKDFGVNVWVAGDADEIAEASAAIFTGKIAGIKILKALGIDTGDNIEDLESKAQIMKCRPPPPTIVPLPEKEEGIFPVIHCTQEIPCDPCTKVCARDLIKMSGDTIMSLPFFTGEHECTGCGKCVAVCPGLAITLVDYRKDPKLAHVTFPVELGEKSIKKGDTVHVMSNTCEIGDYQVERVRVLKEYEKTVLVTVKLPKELAKEVTGIQVQKIATFEEPMEIYHKVAVSDDAIVCRCERVTAGEIRKWIRRGVTDMNELKAITRAGMGACGGKTCNLLIQRIFREEGIDNVVLGTPRPLFIEVPLGIFANVKEMDD